MQKSAFMLALILAIQTQAQVIDVNGDNTVGPEEAIAVAEQWKAAASTPNLHNHLGQTWRPTGSGRALAIRGNFPDYNVIIIGPLKGDKQSSTPIPGAALILDNTASNGAELQFGGSGVIEALDTSTSSIRLRANQSVSVDLQEDGEGNTASFNISSGRTGSLFRLLEGGILKLYADLEIFPGDGPIVAKITRAGDMQLDGNLTVDGTINGMKLKHSSVKGDPDSISHIVSSSQPLSVFTGKVTLDEGGEAPVELPPNVSEGYDGFNYQLTAVGASAPGLFVAQELESGQFSIAGGVPGMKVCWQVIGVQE